MTHALRQENEELNELDEDAGGEDLEGAEGDERVEAAFQPEDHPRAPAGTGNGGEFTGGGGSGSGSGNSSKKPARRQKKTSHRGAPAAKPNIPDGQLGFDGHRGTGYGGSDAHVEELQDELNRLHVTDDQHHKLRKDGQFGPLTTQAVKEAQRRLGMNPTGIVSPAFIDRLKSLKSLPAGKARTKAAGRVEAAAELLAIELARPGTWQLSSGEQTFTAEMLRDAARFAARAGARPAPVKLGHVDDRFDGEPAFGWVGNLRVEEDDQGPVLLGDITGMPDWLAAAAPTAWPDRSVEGWTDFLADGEKYSFVIDGLALLGVTPPGISSIRSLRDLPAALGIAASARIVARAPKPTSEPAARPAAAPVTAATAAALIHNAPVRGAGRMDPAKIREACGLAADASDDEVASTLVAAGLVPAAPDPVAAAVTRDAPGTMRVDASAWQEREDRLARLEAALQKQRENERDQVITAAIKAGKFTPARRQHWTRMWDADPEGARELIASLQSNVVPVEALGVSDGADDPDEYASLFPPARKAS